MSHKFTETERTEIKEYYRRRRGKVRAVNAFGEETLLFDIFAAVPRIGSLNAYERSMEDLAKVMQMEMKQKNAGGGISIVW